MNDIYSTCQTAFIQAIATSPKIQFKIIVLFTYDDCILFIYIKKRYNHQSAALVSFAGLIYFKR